MDRGDLYRIALRRAGQQAQTAECEVPDQQTARQNAAQPRPIRVQQQVGNQHTHRDQQEGDEIGAEKGGTLQSQAKPDLPERQSCPRYTGPPDACLNPFPHCPQGGEQQRLQARLAGQEFTAHGDRKEREQCRRAHCLKCRQPEPRHDDHDRRGGIRQSREGQRVHIQEPMEVDKVEATEEAEAVAVHPAQAYAPVTCHRQNGKPGRHCRHPFQYTQYREQDAQSQQQRSGQQQQPEEPPGRGVQARGERLHVVTSLPSDRGRR